MKNLIAYSQSKWQFFFNIWVWIIDYLLLQNSNLYTSLVCGVNDKGVPIEVRVSLKTICPVLLPTANMFLDCGCHAKLRGEFSNGEESVGKNVKEKTYW